MINASTITLGPCANCGKPGKGWMSCTAWGHSHKCCSEACGQRLGQRIQNGMAPQPHWDLFGHMTGDPIALRWRIKHLEAQIRQLGGRPRGTPLGQLLMASADADESPMDTFGIDLPVFDAPALQRAYTHGEAFCLMQYTCQACGHEEMIWNSRDGVTPFIVDCAECGGSAEHTNWQRDRQSPNHQLTPGRRYFRDMTEADAQASAHRMFDQAKGTEYERPEEDRKEFVATVVGDLMRSPGQPWLDTWAGGSQ